MFVVVAALSRRMLGVGYIAMLNPVGRCFYPVGY